MDPDQFDEWAGFDAVQPIGVDRLYEVLARIAMAVAESGGAKSVQMTDILPWLKALEPPETPEQIAARYRDRAC